MDQDARALQLIGQIYRAVVGEIGWRDFAGDLSAAFGGSLVCLCLGAPRDPRFHELDTAGLAEDFGASFWRNWLDLLPWNRSHLPEFAKGFCSAGEAFPGLAVADSDFYRVWMEPRGLPPVWPICLSVAPRPIHPEAAIVILRQPGAACADFSQRDAQLGNLLISHLQRGFELHKELVGIDWDRRALQEMVDRLHMGVILLDSECRLLKSNASADRTLAAPQGLMLRSGKLCAFSASDDRNLQDAIARAMESHARQRFQRDEYVEFAPDASELNLTFVVKPLLSGAPGSAVSDAAVAVFVADPSEVSTFPLPIARRLYSLTRTEAELVHLLVEGVSLSEAAKLRGVTVATARGQLKGVFTKTGTKRQSELVQVVVAGIMAVWESWVPEWELSPSDEEDS